MTQRRTGTYGATGGLGQTTWWNASLEARLACFAVAVTALVFLIISIIRLPVGGSALNAGTSAKPPIS